MRVDCPSCAARYDVPDDRMLPGRAMRCARCGTDWVPELAEPKPAPRPHPFMAQTARAASETPPDAPPDIPEITEQAPSPPRPQRSPALAVAWVASIAVLAGAGWAVVTHRGFVEQAWPASTRLFAWLGAT